MKFLADDDNESLNINELSLIRSVPMDAFTLTHEIFHRVPYNEFFFSVIFGFLSYE